MTLYLAGPMASGSGYPNAENTLRILRQRGTEVVNCGAVLPKNLALWRLSKGPISVRLWAAVRFVLLGLCSAIGVLLHTRGRVFWVYVPYPSLFFLFWMSLIPSCLRPKCVADAFISVWDSAFSDRDSSGGRSWSAKLLKWVEGRGLRCASLVLVDTVANEQRLKVLFKLDPSRVRSIPLALPPVTRPIQPVAPAQQAQLVKVLFVGTLVPLHGMDAILTAVRQLSHRLEIRFQIVGDGQDAIVLERFLATEPAANLTWSRGWFSDHEIQLAIESADVCLGVFGGKGKASRVLPFKLYHYFRCGKAVITQADYSLPRGCPKLDGTAMLTAPEKLAESIASLCDDQVLRSTYAAAGYDYFNRFLSEDALRKAWSGLPGVVDHIRSEDARSL